MSDKYILKDRKPVRCDDLVEWSKQFGSASRIVAQTNVRGINVSTVFLGIDHNFSGGAPLLFETMVFGIGEDESQVRCSTWEEAEVQHAEAVAKAALG